MKTKLTHSPISKYSIFEQAWLAGDAIDHAPAPMPNTGPHQCDCEGDFLSSIAGIAISIEPYDGDCECCKPEPPAMLPKQADFYKLRDWGAVCLLVSFALAATGAAWILWKSI